MFPETRVYELSWSQVSGKSYMTQSSLGSLQREDTVVVPPRQPDPRAPPSTLLMRPSGLCVVTIEVWSFWIVMVPVLAVVVRSLCQCSTKMRSFGVDSSVIQKRTSTPCDWTAAGAMTARSANKRNFICGRKEESRIKSKRQWC